MRQQLKAQENVIQGYIEYDMYMEAHLDMSVILQKSIWSTTGSLPDHCLHVVTAAVILLHCLLC